VSKLIAETFDFRCGSRLCENSFLETETKFCVVIWAFAAIMNRPRYLLDSIIAQKDSASAFSHSLGQKETFRPAASAHRFLRHSPLSSLVGRIPMERRLAAILAADVVG